MSMRRLVALLSSLLIVAAFAGCGDGDVDPGRTWPATPTPVAVSQTPALGYEPSPEPPKELRVAFINLLSPLSADATSTVAAETFEARLAIIIEQLREFRPDVVGFNEASITKQHGSAVTKLAKVLKMEPQYFRANPWLPGQSKEQSDELVKQVGFEEGELLLVRSDRFPIKQAESYVLNPRSSESGERRIAIHAVLIGPDGVGDIDVFITHLTGGSDRIIRAQAYDFATMVAKQRGFGPTIAMVGQSDPTAASTYEFYKAIALHDVAGKEPIVTCCRESVRGPQPDLTARSDYLMGGRWPAVTYRVFGDVPAVQDDATLLYASDHNGIIAVFSFPEPRVTSGE
ncbi:MAG: hypothetical protein ACKVVT_03135 [Dehalococcoidia bacterium]